MVQTMESEAATVQSDVSTVQSDVPTVQINGLTNWTGLTEIPFEVMAERVLEMEAEGQHGKLTVSFAKPVDLGHLGWACVYKLDAMGRVHVAPVRGFDAVGALQAAFNAVHKQLSGMKRIHTITFGGGDDLGFAPAGAEPAIKTGAGCPVMGGGLGA